jgi:hypothetical protein
MRVTAEITEEQKEFLEILIHEDAASTIGGRTEPGNAIQWCIDACMKIERRYGVDACFVGWNDIRLAENQQGLKQVIIELEQGNAGKSTKENIKS